MIQQMLALSDITLRKIKVTNVYLCKYLCVYVYVYVYVCLLIIFSLSSILFLLLFPSCFLTLILPSSILCHLLVSFFSSSVHNFFHFQSCFSLCLIFVSLFSLYIHWPFFHLLSQTSENGLHVAWFLPSIPFPLPSYSACCSPELVMAVVFSKAEPFYSEI